VVLQERDDTLVSIQGGHSEIVQEVTQGTQREGINHTKCNVVTFTLYFICTLQNRALLWTQTQGD